MKYVTINDLSCTIRKNIWKIPRDIDFIIGVPRSGMIAASIISNYLNVPLIDVKSFNEGLEPWGGLRLDYFNKKHIKTNKILVIDDTVSSGNAMKKVKNELESGRGKNFQITYACVYMEGWAEDAVDIYLDDLRQYTNGFTEYVIYEWNIFQHHSDTMKTFLFDIDGVLCINPPDERNEKEYIEYIKNATPLFIPKTDIGGIITYRLIKNKDITKKWLSDNKITYGELTMFNANSWEERKNTGISSELYKADFYKKNDKYKLFIESDDHQARVISEMAKKPVYCVETNKLYQTENDNGSYLDMFIGAYKAFKSPITNPAYKIIVGNHRIKNGTNLELIKCGDKNDVLDDKFYSELYMLRNIEKSKELKNYVGFCHYRKYFSFLNNIPDLNNLFSTYDCIVGKPLNLKATVKKQYASCHNVEDLEIIGKIIDEKYPEYSHWYKVFLNGTIMIPYNMFIMKKEDFKKYIEFIFGVLDEYINIVGTDIVKRIEDNKGKYIKDKYPDNSAEYQYRIGGYLGERLTNIFMLGNFKKMKFYDVIITEDKYKKEK